MKNKEIEFGKLTFDGEWHIKTYFRHKKEIIDWLKDNGDKLECDKEYTYMQLVDMGFLDTYCPDDFNYRFVLTKRMCPVRERLVYDLYFDEGSDN